jgi:hypothetical protein
MEESDELLCDGAVGHSVQLESFDSEKTANDPKLKSGEIKPQDDGSVKNEEGKGVIISRSTEVLMKFLGMWCYPVLIIRCENIIMHILFHHVTK